MLWSARSSNEIVADVPTRSLTFTTSPYAVLIAVGFALAIALCRVRPGVAMSLTGGLLVLQLLFWPARLSQTSWVAYLALVPLAVGLSAYGADQIRRALLAMSIACSVVVSALLNFPLLSLSGVYGTINGKEADSIEVLQGFVAWTVVGSLLTLGAWRLGSKIRARATQPAPEDPSELYIDAADANGSEPDGDFGRWNPGSADMTSIAALSVREKEIFLLAARGLSNGNIARLAHIGESTVKTHLSSILSKLGLNSRAQIVAHAYQNELLRPPPPINKSPASEVDTVR